VCTAKIQLKFVILANFRLSYTTVSAWTPALKDSSSKSINAKNVQLAVMSAMIEVAKNARKV